MNQREIAGRIRDHLSSGFESTQLFEEKGFQHVALNGSFGKDFAIVRVVSADYIQVFIHGQDAAHLTSEDDAIGYIKSNCVMN